MGSEGRGGGNEGGRVSKRGVRFIAGRKKRLPLKPKLWNKILTNERRNVTGGQGGGCRALQSSGKN